MLFATMAQQFQFHKGTIRTVSDDLAKQLLDNFNSIKVQLEQTMIALRLIALIISIP